MLQTPEAKTAGIPLLDYYEAVERASADMLDAARAGEWDRVVELESACTVLIAQLKQAAATQSLAGTERRRKANIMRRILLADAQIRSLSDLPMVEVEPTSAGHTLH